MEKHINKPKWIVFDVGGVLLDWKGGLSSASKLIGSSNKELLDFLQLHLESLELGELTGREFWQLVVDHFSTNTKAIEVEKAWVTGQPEISSGWNLAHKLNQNFKLAICTNNWLGVMENQINKITNFKIFEYIIDSSQEKTRKPNLEMYKLVENKLISKKDDIYFIDDSALNIEAAQKVGWQTYLYDFESDKGENSAKQIERLLK